MYLFLSLITLFAFVYVAYRYISSLPDAPHEIVASKLEKMQKTAKIVDERQEKKKLESIENLLETAHKAVLAKKFEMAKNKYKQVLEKDENNLAALASMGALLLKQENYNMALSIFDKAHRIDPLEPSVLANLGLVHLAKKDYDKAADSLEHSIAIDPSVPKRHFNLALIYKQMDKQKQYLSELEKLIELDERKDYLELLGEGYFEQKQYKKARDVYERITKIDKKDVSAKQMLSRIEQLINKK